MIDIVMHLQKLPCPLTSDEIVNATIKMFIIQVCMVLAESEVYNQEFLRVNNSFQWYDAFSCAIINNLVMFFPKLVCMLMMTVLKRWNTSFKKHG
eukprot:UN06077